MKKSRIGWLIAVAGLLILPSSTVHAASFQTCSAAATPAGLKASIVSGMVVRLTWTFAMSNLSYVVEIGRAPGATDVMVIETKDNMTSRFVQLPAGTYFVRVRGKNGCVSSPSQEVSITVSQSSVDDAPAINFRCPTAVEVAAIDAEVRVTFDGDPTAGTIVCAVGSRPMTQLETQAYRSLIIMRRLTFDAPLPWTSQSLYGWMTQTIRGIRFRSDIQSSFCCNPEDTINIQTGVSIASSTLGPDPQFIVGFIELLVHEARHNNIGGHTCGANDQTLTELGAWGAQYYTALWIADHSDVSFIPPNLRESERRAAVNLIGRFCTTPPATPPSITTQPLSKTVIAGQNAVFTVAASGTPAPSYQWQRSTNDGATWTNLSDTSPYSGSATATLTVTSVTASLSGSQFRAVATNSVTTSTSNAATLSVPDAPAITTQPLSRTIVLGRSASFSVAASGTPAPTYQWQLSTNGGATWGNLSDAVPYGGSATATLTVTSVTASLTGTQFRAVATNSYGTATSNAATLTVSPTERTISLDRTSLIFTAITSGVAFTSQTAAQTVRLTQNGAGTVTWTAVSTTPWLIVSPTSGSGPATLTISTRFAAGLTALQIGSINLTLAGATDTAGPINVTLNVVSSTAPASPPFGSFDTPAGDATVLAGSVAVTGWTLDNIGVKELQLWRDLQPGETTPVGNSTPGDPRNGKIFIANATFVDNARPDVEALNPTVSANYRAGWGYLMLTWGLFGQGNGTYRLYAFGVDQEGNFSTIGSKTIVVSNNSATKPFGSIDNPSIGGDPSVPPQFTNLGWGLTPKVNGAATCKIQPNGVQVSIDSGPLQPVVYGDARPDISGAFLGFSNSAAAGGHFAVDWSTLANGSHTIGWLITDDCGRADGVGSRFFNISTGTSTLTAPPGYFRASPVASAFRRNRVPEDASAFGRNEHLALTLTRGFNGGSELVEPGEDGVYAIEIKQGERIELRTPREFGAAVQIAPDDRERALPIGASWDEGSNTFYWQPAPGFLGRFRIVFSSGFERLSVRIVVTP